MEELPLYEQMQNNLKNLIDALNEEKWFVEKIMLQNTIEETLKGIEIKISEGYELLEGTGGFHKNLSMGTVFSPTKFSRPTASAENAAEKEIGPRPIVIIYSTSF